MEPRTADPRPVLQGAARSCGRLLRRLAWRETVSDLARGSEPHHDLVDPKAHVPPGFVALLPSFGVFGGIEANHLKVPVDEDLSGLMLSLDGNRPARLDLRGVHFYRRKRRVTVDPRQVRARQSSLADALLDAEGAFSLRAIRTLAEVGPWWMATFDPPVEADELRVFNRMDGEGVHSRQLRVSIPGDRGKWRVVEDASGVDHAGATLSLITRLTGVDVSASELTEAARGRQLRLEVLEALAERAPAAPLTTDAEEQRLLFGLLPTVAAKQRVDLTDDEWTLLAHLLVAERKRIPRSATSFRLFSRVLTSRASLERLDLETRRAGESAGLGPTSLTRHGIRELGQLRKEADAHLTLMARVQEEFAALGLPIMLAYGTLLGAVREGDFLEHDDDVDLMYPVEAKTAKQARACADSVCEALASRGFRIWRNESPSALNFHVTDPGSGCHVDIFPILVDGDSITLHMENMKLRTIPRDLILPPRALTFRQAPFQGPADPEGFLAERYGSGWSIPDPYHDWIWPLRG